MQECYSRKNIYYWKIKVIVSVENIDLNCPFVAIYDIYGYKYEVGQYCDYAVLFGFYSFVLKSGYHDVIITLYIPLS